MRNDGPTLPQSFYSGSVNGQVTGRFPTDLTEKQREDDPTSVI